MRGKRLPGVDARAEGKPEGEEGQPAKRIRTRFVELQPSVTDPGQFSLEQPSCGAGRTGRAAHGQSSPPHRPSDLGPSPPLPACPFIADGIEEEVPGSAPADVETLVLGDGKLLRLAARTPPLQHLGS